MKYKLIGVLPAKVPNVTNHTERLVGRRANSKGCNTDGIGSSHNLDALNLHAGV